MKTKNKKLPHPHFPLILREGNKNQKAFTLVELIIVITILAILATIAFIGFQNFAKDSRDGNRIATLTQIEKGLNLVQIQTGKYPLPDGDVLTGALNLGGSELIYSHMGIIDENISRLIKINKTPLDPVSNSKYVYAVNNKQDTYQIATLLESLEANTKLPFIEQTYANENYKAKVVGNHQVNVKISNARNTYLTIVPSMIFNPEGGNILNTGSTYHIINGGQNLPYKTNDKTITTKETGDKIIQHIRKSQDAKIITVDITDIINEKNETTRKTLIETKFGTGSETEEVLPGITSKEALASIGAISGTNETIDTQILTQTVETIINGGSVSTSISTPPPAKLNCEIETIEDYEIGQTNHNSTYNAEKIINITQGTQTYKQTFTCDNGTYSKTGTEEILSPNCNTHYVASGDTCVLDTCTGTPPENSELNGTQGTGTWEWNQTTPGLCKYKCIDGYDTTSCTPKIQTVTSATHNSRNYTFTSFTLAYNTPQTKTSSALSITNGTVTLTALFTLESDGTTVSLSEQVENVTCNTNYTLNNGNCEGNSYTLTFDSQGGNAITSKSVIYGNTYGTLTSPTRTGYTFNGWFTATSGGTQVTSSTNVTATANHTLYARWSCASGWGQNGTDSNGIVCLQSPYTAWGACSQPAGISNYEFHNLTTSYTPQTTWNGSTWSIGTSTAIGTKPTTTRVTTTPASNTCEWRCKSGSEWNGSNCVQQAKSCLVLKNAGNNTSGRYTIYPGGSPIDVFCDMTTNGGGWTLIGGTNISGGNNGEGQAYIAFTNFSNYQQNGKLSNAHISDILSTNSGQKWIWVPQEAVRSNTNAYGKISSFNWESGAVFNDFRMYSSPNGTNSSSHCWHNNSYGFRSSSRSGASCTETTVTQGQCSGGYGSTNRVSYCGTVPSGTAGRGCSDCAPGAGSRATYILVR